MSADDTTWLATAKQRPPTGADLEVPTISIDAVDLNDDLEARASVGRESYGTPLRIFNGRDPLVDAYQEALDLVMYLRQDVTQYGRGGVLTQRGEHLDAAEALAVSLRNRLLIDPQYANRERWEARHCDQQPVRCTALARVER